MRRKILVHRGLSCAPVRRRVLMILSVAPVLVIGACERLSGWCREGSPCPEGTVCNVQIHACGPPPGPDLLAPPPPDLSSPDFATPADLSEKLYKFTIKGAVALNVLVPASNQRFRPSMPLCPGMLDFIMVDPEKPKVSNSNMAVANWECSQPDFYYGKTYVPPSNSSVVELRSTTQLFTVEMPPGYTCVDAYYYQNNAGRKAPAAFTGAGTSTCSQLIEAGPPADPNLVTDLFLWFKVQGP